MNNRSRNSLNYLLGSGFLAVLLYVAWPSFFDPPRSDFWTIFYFYHHLGDIPAWGGWLHIMNFDSFTQVRFQPLAFLLIFAEFLLFARHFLFYHIAFFAAYCISIWLVYLIGLEFVRNKTVMICCAGLYGVLYSHFDTVSWAYHIYILAAFIFCMAGFLLYIRYMRSQRRAYLFWCAVSFLAGVFCYETFILWPLGIILLPGIPGLMRGAAAGTGRLAAASTRVLSWTYAAYTCAFFVTRFVRTYDRPLLSWHDLFSYGRFVSAGCAVLFNAAYNGIIVNIAPLVSLQPRFYDDVYEMGGLLLRLEPHIDTAVCVSGIGIGAGIAAVLWYLARRRRFEAIKTYVFFLFLLVSQSFLLFYFRSVTNPLIFNFQQFRYQYVSNALIAIIAAYALKDIVERSRAATRVLAGCFCIVFFS